LPHPSGASPWHKIPPGRELTVRALKLIARHAATRELKVNLEPKNPGILMQD
jgi:uracil-DNA glycosylase